LRAPPDGVFARFEAVIVPFLEKRRLTHLPKAGGKFPLTLPKFFSKLPLHYSFKHQQPAKGLVYG